MAKETDFAHQTMYYKEQKLGIDREVLTNRAEQTYIKLFDRLGSEAHWLAICSAAHEAFPFEDVFAAFSQLRF